MRGIGGATTERLQLAQAPQAPLHRGAAGAARQALQHDTAIGNLAAHQGAGDRQATLLGQSRLPAGPVPVTLLHRLQAPQALPAFAEIRDRNPSTQAGANQLGGELHVPDHQNLIQQGQTHSIKLLLVAGHHELLAIQGSGAMGTKQIKGPHGNGLLAIPVFPRADNA